MACEQAAVRAIAYGRTTWQELFELGLSTAAEETKRTENINGASRLIVALRKARLTAGKR